MGTLELLNERQPGFGDFRAVLHETVRTGVFDSWDFPACFSVKETVVVISTQNFFVSCFPNTKMFHGSSEGRLMPGLYREMARDEPRTSREDGKCSEMK